MNANEHRIYAKGEFERADWNQAVKAFTNLKSEGELTADEQILFGIAAANAGKLSIVKEILTPSAQKRATNTILIRRLGIKPAIVEEKFEIAEALLRAQFEAFPEDVGILALLASVLMRLGERTSARAILEEVHRLDPENISTLNQLLLIYIQSNQLEEASTVAVANKARWRENQRFAQLSATALAKAGDNRNALEAAEALERFEALETGAAQIATDILMGAGENQRALTLCRSAFERGSDSVRLRFFAAKSIVKMHGELDEAIDHLNKALEQDPSDLLSKMLIGQVQMRQGAYKDAIPHFESAVEQAPTSAHARVRLGQAYKYSGNFSDAANVLLEAIGEGTSSDSWHRLAMSALLQADREDEARLLFAEYASRKRQSLPNSLVNGLEFLNTNLARVEIPQARLDWAWHLMETSGHNEFTDDRKNWEDRARWGHLADELISNWLEANPERRGEIIDVFCDVSAQTQLLKEALAKGRGAFLASAHVGPLYAGPLAVRNLDVKFKWLASTPRISSMAYKDDLISTSDQSEIKIVSAVNRALAENCAVLIAIDGAQNPTAPTVVFEDQHVTYSSFVAKMSYRKGAPSFFAAPLWQQRKIDFYLDPMPDPEEDESLDRFVARWNKSYFDKLRQILVSAPENLRLAGGIWRSIS